MKDYLPQLAQMPLFEAIDPEDLPEMLQCLQIRRQRFPRDSYVRSEGDPADFIGIVLQGNIHIQQDDYSGRRTITASFGPGDMFAEAIACAELPALPFSILSVTDSEILFIDVKRLMHQCEGVCAFHSRLIRNLLKIVSQKNLLLNQKLYCVSRRTTAEKILTYLNEQARRHHSREFTIPFDRQGLADYLGVERSAMSAELSKLRRQGVLETKRNWFRLEPGI